MLDWYGICEKNVNEKYEGYLGKKEEYSKLDFGYSVLLNLCQGNLRHTEQNKIYAKIWIIGRSFAASIDRRKTKTKKTCNNFYLEEVVPTILSVGEYLDTQIEKLNQYECMNEEYMKEALKLHKFLTDAFRDLTELNMRSLVSKYLHFHCPNMFFIYSSIANAEIKKLVNKSNKRIKFGYDLFDQKYADFSYRALALMNYIKETKPNENDIKPRDIDNILYKGDY